MNTVLIIEDDQPSLAMYDLALQSAGYKTLTAIDGEKGLELAKAHLPDVILCDINLPSRNGWKILQSIRGDNSLATTQFIFMTGNTQANSNRSGMEQGADDFLEKPFGADDLVHCVEARLKRAGLNSKVSDEAFAQLRQTLRSNLPHELFTPLAGIIGLTDILLESHDDFTPEQCLNYMREVNASAIRLHRTLRNYLFALNLDHQNEMETLHPPPLDAERIEIALSEGIQAAAKRHQRTRDLKINLVPTSFKAFITDLSIMIEELVDNACAYSSAGTPIEITLTKDHIFIVQDHGRGLSETELDKIGAFQQFNRDIHEQQGLGLGLFLVHKMARRGDINVQIKSEPGRGTKVSLSFPAATKAP